MNFQRLRACAFKPKVAKAETNVTRRYVRFKNHEKVMASTSSGQASLAELWPARSRHGSQRLKRTKPKKKGQGGDSHQSTVKKDAIRWRCRLQYLIGCFEKELKYLNIQVKKLTGRTPSTSTSKRRSAAKGSIGLTSFIKRTLGRPSINK